MRYQATKEICLVLLLANTMKEWKHLPAVSVPYSKPLMDQVTQKF
jgi:hypothetical protein